MKAMFPRILAVLALLAGTAALFVFHPGRALAAPADLEATLICHFPEPQDPGAVTCVGGTYDPVAYEYPFCSPETRQVRIRGAMFKWTFAAADVDSSQPSLFIGSQFTTNNANYDLTGSGPEWGTFVWRDPQDRLLWEGTFEVTALGRHKATWSAVAHGTGAAMGLQWKGSGTFDTGQPYGIFHLRVSGTAR